MSGTVSGSFAETAAAWEKIAELGWDDRPEQITVLYPMPGDPRFDNDDLFLQLPLFPSPDGKIIRVSDSCWEFPLAWLRAYETRRRSERQINFRLRVGGEIFPNHNLHARLLLAWKRAVYLEIFRLRRPLSIRTFRARAKLYRSFVEYAACTSRELDSLTYGDLAAIVSGIREIRLRRSTGVMYETLRWWKAQPGRSYCFFEPPPSLGAVSGAGLHRGLDTTSVRADVPVEEDRKWQPLPDRFVGALGKVVLSLIEEVHPVMIDCCHQLAAVRERLSLAGYRRRSVKIIESCAWPEGISPQNELELRTIAYRCQTAIQILVSLLLGPRAEEMLSLPSHSVRCVETNQGTSWFIDGLTFKGSQGFGGELRDWPVHPILGRALVAQREYVVVTEGHEFPWMWKSHTSLFEAGAPARGVWSQINRFAKHYELLPLLDGSSLHHHRFRKTLARLIVIALHGGPMILRRLFGHEHLAMTLRYILADESIVSEIREIAEQEQKQRAAAHVARAGEIGGKGGERFRNAVRNAEEILKLVVPDGKRDQAEVATADVVELLADGPDGVTIQQLVPGLLSCFKPRDKAGNCCSANELPNVAACDAECSWNGHFPEYKAQASANVRNALEHIQNDPTNPLTLEHYRGVVLYWIDRFPDLQAEFGAVPEFQKVFGGTQ